MKSFMHKDFSIIMLLAFGYICKIYGYFPILQFRTPFFQNLYSLQFEEEIQKHKLTSNVKRFTRINVQGVVGFSPMCMMHQGKVKIALKGQNIPQPA